jgi:hypothetical protein
MRTLSLPNDCPRINGDNYQLTTQGKKTSFCLQEEKFPGDCILFIQGTIRLIANYTLAIAIFIRLSQISHIVV